MVGGRRWNRVDPGEQPPQAATHQVGVDRADQVRMAAAADETTLLVHNAIDLGLCSGHVVRMRIRRGRCRGRQDLWMAPGPGHQLCRTEITHSIRPRPRHAGYSYLAGDRLGDSRFF